jgi:hypothetical protein
MGKLGDAREVRALASVELVKLLKETPDDFPLRLDLAGCQVAAALQLRGRNRHHRGADRDRQGITGHQPSGLRDADREIGGDLRQQTHDDEFSGAYRK